MGNNTKLPPYCCIFELRNKNYYNKGKDSEKNLD
jgi:hypothetical protein